VYDFEVGQHVVLPGEILAADRTREHLDVQLVRGHVVPAEVADVSVDPAAHRASVQIVLLPHAEVPRRLVRVADLLRVVDVLEGLEVVRRVVEDDLVVGEVVHVDVGQTQTLPLLLGAVRDPVEDHLRVQLDVQRFVVGVQLLDVVVVLF
jgi:hypothetical protein